MAKPSEEMARDRADGVLHPGPFVPGHSIQQNESQHAWIIDQTLLSCSPTEYLCLKLLLEQADRCVPFAHFIAQFQDGSLSDATLRKQAKMKVAHLMSNLRAKIWPLGLDIGSVMGVGYILLSSESSTPLDEQAN